MDRLKILNDSIMQEMMEMNYKINQQIEKLDITDKQVKKKETEYQIEREATDHLKDILKKSLAGKLNVKDLEDDKSKGFGPQKNQTINLEEKITLDKFLAIMTAIKNEKEVLHKSTY